jgi:hypothetical protein
MFVVTNVWGRKSSPARVSLRSSGMSALSLLHPNEQTLIAAAGRYLTNAEKGGLIASIVSIVPVKSHCRLPMPP